jgi:hypothetical protein
VRRVDSGHSLIEALFAVSLIGLFVVAAVPAFASIQRRAALRNASAEMRSVFHSARSRAITRGANAGLKFIQIGGEWHFALYDDGDGDGIRNDDIRSGVDRSAGPPRPVLPMDRKVRIGLLNETIRDPDGALMPPTASPVRFGTSTICSFSPLGQASSGTIYVTDRGRDLYAIRVFGGSARIRVIRYNRDSRKWEK